MRALMHKVNLQTSNSQVHKLQADPFLTFYTVRLVLNLFDFLSNALVAISNSYIVL